MSFLLRYDAPKDNLVTMREYAEKLEYLQTTLAKKDTVPTRTVNAERFGFWADGYRLCTMENEKEKN